MSRYEVNADDQELTTGPYIGIDKAAYSLVIWRSLFYSGAALNSNLDDCCQLIWNENLNCPLALHGRGWGKTIFTKIKENRSTFSKVRRLLNSESLVISTCICMIFEYLRVLFLLARRFAIIHNRRRKFEVIMLFHENIRPSDNITTQHVNMNLAYIITHTCFDTPSLLHNISTHANSYSACSACNKM